MSFETRVNAPGSIRDAVRHELEMPDVLGFLGLVCHGAGVDGAASLTKKRL
ncbi:MAG: hypothetical protein Q7K57_58295 [Burkholderiaceae bacterium]|nr:hypothetical protein [Burkholderiaceae bacterium]